MDFRTLEEFPHYEIYTNGMIIRGKKRGINGNKLKRREIHPTRAKNGYYTVRLYGKDGRIRQFYLHRLVYIAFHGDIGKLEVEHKDGNRANNSISNLRATTHKDNCSNEVSMERYRIANALDRGKFDRDKMIAAKSQDYYNKLVITYKKLKKQYGYCGIWMLMREGHCGYPRAKKLIAEMEEKCVQTIDIQNIS